MKYGDRVYYDDNPGKVETLVYAQGSTDLVSVEVLWDNGHKGWVSPHDLLTEAQWHEFCEEVAHE